MDKTVKRNPIVSVIMPVYNGGKYIGAAIESMLKQSYPYLELIIVNDGSTDKSDYIISRYEEKDSRIRYFKNRKNIGISGTLNIGIGYARGKYIARMDCDDISLPDRLKNEVDVMNRDVSIAICGSWGRAIGERDNYLFSMKSPTGLILKYNYWKPSPFISSSVMVRKKIFEKLKFNEEMAIAEDYDLWVRILRQSKGFNIREFLVDYRIHGESITKNKEDMCNIMSMRSFIKNFGFPKISLNEYLSLVCLKFDLSFIERFSLLKILKKIANYPIWMIVIDNIYYEYRKILFALKPEFKKY